jgi:hypothetical protein
MLCRRSLLYLHGLSLGRIANFLKSRGDGGARPASSNDSYGIVKGLYGIVPPIACASKGWMGAPTLRPGGALGRTDALGTIRSMLERFQPHALAVLCILSVPPRPPRSSLGSPALARVSAGPNGPVAQLPSSRPPRPHHYPRSGGMTSLRGVESSRARRKVSVNLEPMPTVLSTVRSPFMARARSRLIARPSPTPP